MTNTPDMTRNDNLLEVHGLKTHFFTDDGILKAVDGVTFSLRKGRTLGVVGESGCGKSITSLSIMRLVDKPGRIVDGQIFFKGRNLLELSPQTMQSIRGNEIAMIFQDPMTALNPVLTIGDQLSEVLLVHQSMKTAKARTAVVQMLADVGITDPARRFSQYPHSLSGGIQQRAMIAMALLCKPDLLIADEPTTALDVTIQAQILALIKEMKRELGTSILFITHDLGVIAELADDIIVMYGGKIVEAGPVRDIFKRSRHPYTIGLLRCLPRLDRDEEELFTIRGRVPSLLASVPGCAFYMRCPYVQNRCRESAPELTEVGPGHQTACWRWAENIFIGPTGEGK